MGSQPDRICLQSGARRAIISAFQLTVDAPGNVRARLQGSGNNVLGWGGMGAMWGVMAFFDNVVHEGGIVHYVARNEVGYILVFALRRLCWYNY